MLDGSFVGKKFLWANGGQTFTLVAQKTHKDEVFGLGICDEARHGKALEGMLKRYFK